MLTLPVTKYSRVCCEQASATSLLKNNKTVKQPLSEIVVVGAVRVRREPMSLSFDDEGWSVVVITRLVYLRGSGGALWKSGRVSGPRFIGFNKISHENIRGKYRCLAARFRQRTTAKGPVEPIRTTVEQLVRVRTAAPSILLFISPAGKTYSMFMEPRAI